MNKLILLALTCILLSLTFCSRRNPERNLIEFNDSVPAVEDSVRRIQALLYKADITNYFITHDGDLAVNSKVIGKINSIREDKRLFTLKIFQTYSEQEAIEFINLVLFLKDNFIESAFKHSSFDRYLFIYRQIASNEYNDFRALMIIKNKSDTINRKFASFQILDKKQNLVLLAPDDVDI